MIHGHWTIVGYEAERDMPNTGGKFYDYIVEISVDADSEDEAMKKAKETITRPFYRVTKVFRCEKDHDLDTEMHMLQLKFMKESLKKHG